MGQHPKWHAEQLNRYISDLSKRIHSIRSLDNYHSNHHFTSSDNTNDGNENFVQNYGISNSNGNGNSVTSFDPLATTTTATINNTLQSLARRQLHNFSSSFVERLSDAIQSALTADLRAEHANTSAATKLNDAENDDASIISNYWMLLLFVLYCIVVLGGIFGNASLIVTLFTQSSARLRNPLLVALCLADLMVTGVSAPLTVIALILDARKTITSTLICKLIHFMQVSCPENRLFVSIFLNVTFFQPALKCDK